MVWFWFGIIWFELFIVFCSILFGIVCSICLFFVVDGIIVKINGGVLGFFVGGTVWMFMFVIVINGRFICWGGIDVFWDVLFFVDEGRMLLEFVVSCWSFRSVGGIFIEFLFFVLRIELLVINEMLLLMFVVSCWRFCKVWGIDIEFFFFVFWIELLLMEEAMLFISVIGIIVFLGRSWNFLLLGMGFSFWDFFFFLIIFFNFFLIIGVFFWVCESWVIFRLIVIFWFWRIVVVVLGCRFLVFCGIYFKE